MTCFQTLIDAATIRRRVHELADQIRASFEVPPCMVTVIEGARTFARHLDRHLPWTHPGYELRAKSYGSGTRSQGFVQVVTAQPIPVRGQHVLVIEDIVDTGHTVAHLRRHFLAAGAADFSVVTLLSKPARRAVDVDLRFVGFEIPDAFVVGFGMDHAERYRELPDVVVFDAALVGGE